MVTKTTIAETLKEVMAKKDIKLTVADSNLCVTTVFRPSRTLSSTLARYASTASARSRALTSQSAPVGTLGRVSLSQ